MQTKIEELLYGGGAGAVSFCRLKDENVFGLGYAVSYLIPLSDAVIDQIDNAPTHTYFHHYRTVNTLIDNLSLRTGLMLAQNGYRYAAVPASQSVNGMQGIFSHKYAAVSAGLGYVGRSGLFVSDKFGPRVRLGTILTDCPFDCEEHTPVFKCGNCSLCVKSCPAMAITGEDWRPGDAREKIIDAKACSDYMKKAFQHIGRGAVCGICMSVCPRGRKNSKENCNE